MSGIFSKKREDKEAKRVVDAQAKQQNLNSSFLNIEITDEIGYENKRTLSGEMPGSVRFLNVFGLSETTV